MQPISELLFADPAGAIAPDASSSERALHGGLRGLCAEDAVADPLKGYCRKEECGICPGEIGAKAVTVHTRYEGRTWESAYKPGLQVCWSAPDFAPAGVFTPCGKRFEKTLGTALQVSGCNTDIPTPMIDTLLAHGLEPEKPRDAAG